MYLACVLALLSIVVLTPVFAESTPLQQLENGTPLNEIQCSADKTLVQSQSGKPACVYENTAKKLESRGWEIVLQDLADVIDGVPGPQDHSTIPKDNPQANFTIPQNITTANNIFAVDFYRQISDNDANLFFSPSGMYVAFSVLYEGARGNTAQQMQDVFGFESDADVRHNHTARAMESLNRDDPHATLAMANALWLADWFSPYESYLDVARGTYLSSVESVDFMDDGVKKINTWASDNTNQKIKTVLGSEDVNHLTAMVITNAIYFKGTWVTQFPTEATQQAGFWTSGAESVNADFMHVTGIFNHTRHDGVQVLKLPYKGDRLSMLVALPSDRDGIAALEESISSEMISQWNQNMSDAELAVSMPKFTMETKYNLGEFLKNLGMTDVFDEYYANLLSIADTTDIRNLYVGKATQDAFVDVNEEGTEAAAVTTITSVTSVPPDFTANHPFLFIIQDDESGMILFMGRLLDPTA